jgi:hypothetical protein
MIAALFIALTVALGGLSVASTVASVVVILCASDL